VVSAGYYVNVLRVMFMKPRPDGTADPERGGTLTRGVVLATAVSILVLGLVPGRVIRWSHDSIPRSPQLPAAAASALR
jgi:NADH:ubiquinone oxidoreductase subunit 2 (subunit N)